MNTITAITAETINDSRGTPTLRVTATAGEISAAFSVPSGASTGAHEVYELRDAETKSVAPAITQIHETIAPHIVGMDATDQKAVDAAILALATDPQKKNLGGNSTLGVSGAVLRLGALLSNVPVYQYLRMQYPEVPADERTYPLCYFNLINGGKHAHSALAVQEYHVVPDCGSVSANLTCAKAVYAALGTIITSTYPETPLGDEGGYALNVPSLGIPLALLQRAVAVAGYEGKVRYALDVAASSFVSEQGYFYEEGMHSTAELLAWYERITKDFPFVSIEDPFSEESFADFAMMRTMLPTVKIIGDDLTVTNKELLEKAYNARAVDGLIIKPNQIGTITETVATIEAAHTRGLACIVSHRSGETTDDTIADIAAAFHCFGLKAGAPGPIERLVKYDRLVSITNEQ